ncbi:AAA family ATPase [Halovenus sp. WSH3]|uniref:AAA family ATPase n=1 Tax=Halovenus carboxidivorans TaxID=2692199 RepID=A0A6B0T0Z0_9EURY|nr:ParA family protein [Halovenus carboxidivorans]MXR51858.1 AAA family ATPase [Halovenus carboxidivorans]
MTGEDTGAARVCVTNAKGGTGKTTIAINIAGALNERGRDVLFVDVDPQGNATEGLGLVEAYDREPPSLFDVLTDHESRHLINDLIVEHEEMDVLPSNLDLLHAEQELTIAHLIAQLGDNRAGVEALSSLAINVEPEGINTPHALGALDEAFDELETAYDYIIVDSPPFYGRLTETSIFATQNVVVPALTEATSERAIELLIDQIAALEDLAGITVNTVGVVANRVEQTNEDLMMVDWLNEVFAGHPVWEVRKRVALQRAFSAGTSIFAYEQSVDMEEVFLDIAAEFDEQFGYTEVTA